MKLVFPGLLQQRLFRQVAMAQLEVDISSLNRDATKARVPRFRPHRLVDPETIDLRSTVAMTMVR